MKYWMFQNNQVVGPYDREELSEQGGFSAESLVCPEGRKGTQMGDWQRAGVVAELAEVLLRKAKVPAGAAGSGSIDPGASLIPPEPTLRDLAVLGTLQEKVSLLENSLSQLHDELRQRDEEITGLKVQLDEKGHEATQLRDQVSGLETRLESTEGGLKEEIGKTKEELSHENELIGELKGQLESVRTDISDSLSKLEENQGKLRDELKEEMVGLRKTGPKTPAFAEEGDEPPNVLPPVEEAADSAPAGLPDLDTPGELSPAPAQAGELGELPPPPAEAGSLEEVPPPVLESPGAELEAPGAELEAPAPEPMTPDAGELPPPPGDLPMPSGDLPPPPGMEMPGLDDAPPALEPEPGDAPAVTLEPPTAGGDLAPPPADLSAPQDFSATPALEPLDTPLPGAQAEPLVPPPTMPAPAPAAGGADADLVDLSAAGVAETAQAKKKGGFFRKLMIFVLLLALIGGGLFQGYQMGILKPYLAPVVKQVKPIVKPYLQQFGLLPKKSTPLATLKDPAESEPAPAEAAPEPVDSMADRTQEAIDFAKNYPVGTSGKTLAQILSTVQSSDRLLEPWNAERRGNGVFQVNFYGKAGGAPDFQFEVLLDAGQIRGLTAKSEQALNGELPAPTARPAAPKRRAARSKRRRGGASRRKRTTPRKELNEDGSLTDPLGQMLLDSSLGDRAPIQEEQAQPAAEEEAPKPVRRRRSRRKAKAAPPPETDPLDEEDDPAPEKSEDELTLDELLLPGVPKR
jgi:hypothetical protein